jgi:penicillin-binding protein 2
LRIYRITVLMVSFLIIFSGLTLLMAYYQIVRGQDLAAQAVAMRSQQIELKEYHRGVIWDRNLLPLTGTRTTSALYCFPQEAFQSEGSPGKKATISDTAINDLAQRLVDIVPGLTSNQVVKDIKRSLQAGEPFIRLATDLTDSQVALLQRQDQPGVIVAPVQKRYVTTGFLAHIIGTVEKGKTVRGLSGIEKVYDDVLSTNPASLEMVSVQDARGEVINGLMYKIRQEQDQARGSVVLTIDKRVQTALETLMDERVPKGAVVVMDIETRQILALASRPTFDPYRVSQVIDTHQESPLINRALTSFYPGSLFKPLVAAAALEEGLVDFATSFHCSGSYRFNEQVEISCWKEEGHGEITFEDALAYSCNPAFIEVAQLVGRKTLLEYAQKLHLTDETLVGYGPYRAGSGISINPGPVALGNAALGQQGVQLTPLQLTSLLATIADDGCWIPPALVLYYTDDQGQQHYPVPQPPEQVLSTDTARKLQHMLSLTVEKGTGRSAALAEVSLAGKTGTSQTGQINEQQEEILNTWFAGYLPAENPRWAVVVMVEEGISGAESAAPVFKDLAEILLQLYPAG